MEKNSWFHRARRLSWLAAALVLPSCACHDGPALPVTGNPRSGPGIPITSGLSLLPALLPQGATASLPSFPGDSFSAVLPVRLQQQLAPAEALQEIEPVLRAFGFERSLAELGVPAAPLPLPPADLSSLSTEICREAALVRYGTSSEVCAALRGDGPPSPKAEAAFQNAYGTSFAAFRTEFERGTFQYSFLQLVDGVPIEGAGVFAFRREGESLSVVHGNLFNQFVVANRPVENGRALLDAARRSLALLAGKKVPVLDGEPVLVLLPHRSERSRGPAGVPELRHAWRVLLMSPKGPESWLAWIDAETGRVLQLAPQWDGATAHGERWRRDPGLPADSADFEVDPAQAGQLTLELDDGPSPVFRRLDIGGDKKYDDGELAMADFSQPPMNASTAVCEKGGSSAFRQIHTYSHLYSLWQVITGAGSIPTFPEKPIEIWLDFPDPQDKGGNAGYYDASTLLYVDGAGFLSNQCPQAPLKRLNGAQDTTILAHEMSHLSVRRLQERRPADWCQSADCAMPQACGRILFHDFADAFGNAYASTNCFSGWTDKNHSGVDKNLYCKGAPTSEAGSFPRLADVAVDRFPEHRALGSGNYADGQIGAAALWEIRQGMRSKDAASGTAQFWRRFQRALWGYAFVQPTCAASTISVSGITTACTACDRDIYRYLQDLERRMVEQWAVEAGGPAAPSGAHTANKVLSGWAKAGIFLIPPVCLDGDATTSDPSVCPGGEGGGDAVIDVDDREDADDLVVDGVAHPEVDYLRRKGPMPGFRVWTGPRFRLDAMGVAKAAGPSLCNKQYRVEVSENPNFPAPLTRKVAGSTTNCFADVDFSGWTDLKGPAGTKKDLYYQVITWDPGPERISTSPGAGAFNVPPPFVVVNDTGKP